MTSDVLVWAVALVGGIFVGVQLACVVLAVIEHRRKR